MELSLTSLLPLAWYVILGVAVFAYSFGDGFDLGLGAVYLKAKEDKERRILLNSIGPVWDGNEVWLVIIVGGLFAGFPACYATLLSIFYMPIWTLVLLYIFRGCSLEFRSKSESVSWKTFWDIIFICSGDCHQLFLRHDCWESDPWIAFVSRHLLCFFILDFIFPSLCSLMWRCSCQCVCYSRFLLRINEDFGFFKC
ncbi:Cytochrome d ubiquinol oxidase subunit II [Chlamydia pneumoniae B21]|nr:Cytochrome d ubiquinol oxidase subunit II [Chlamydia pneumoniae B21]